MLKQSAFFEFLNRRDEPGFSAFMRDSVEDVDFINWNGFSLPNDYGDAEVEYTAIRNSCAIFDVSPIRKIRVQGAGAGELFDHTLTRPVSQLATMRATYAVLCNEDGNLKDDAILYKFAADDYLLMPSDIDHSPYLETLRNTLDIDNVMFTECTDDWVGLAIQGPKSAAVLIEMGFTGVEEIRPFQVRDYTFDGGSLTISRLGFTADLGYECWFSPSLASAIKERIETARATLNIAIPGYGLSALQACRLEGGFIVAGWDCSTEVDPIPGFDRSPYELGLGWLVNLDAAPFVGRDALRQQKEQGFPYTLRSLQLDAHDVPDDGVTLFLEAEGDAVAGIVNCSCWSWGLNKVIGNASIESRHADIETAWLEKDGTRIQVNLSQGPLVNLERRNQFPAPL